MGEAQTIVKVVAAFYQYEPTENVWKSVDGGLSSIEIQQDKDINNKFWLKSSSIADSSLSPITVELSEDAKYQKQSNIYHCVFLGSTVYGINFRSEENANEFAEAFKSSLEKVLNLGDSNAEVKTNEITRPPPPKPKKTGSKDGLIKKPSSPKLLKKKSSKSVVIEDNDFNKIMEEIKRIKEGQNELKGCIEQVQKQITKATNDLKLLKTKENV